MAEAAQQMLSLVALSKTIADTLDEGDSKAANALFHDEAFAVFKSIWATNHTLISNAERRFPRH